MATRAEGYELFKDDWQLMDKIEDVSVADTDGGSDAEIKAKRYDLTIREMRIDPGLGVPGQGIVFHLWVSTISGVVIREETVITDEDGDSWTILSHSLVEWGTQYHCVCLKRK